MNTLFRQIITTKCLMWLLILLTISPFHISATEIELKNVRVGFFALEGFHEEQPDGIKSGYGYEYLQHLANYTRWSFEYIGYDKDWNTILKMLENGEIDVLGFVEKNPERMKNFVFSDLPMGYGNILLTALPDKNKYIPNDYSNWDGVRIGMIKGSIRKTAFDDFAKEKSFTYKCIEYPNNRLLTNALVNNEVDMLFSSDIRKRATNELVYERFDNVPFYFAVNKNSEKLMRELNWAMRKLDEDTPLLKKDLFNSYYNVDIDGNQYLPFTWHERKYIDSLNTENIKIPVLVNPDRVPFSYLENGVMKGIMIDYLDIISKKSGLQFELLDVKTRSEYQAIFNTRNDIVVLDMRHNYAWAEKNKVNITRQYLTVPISLLRLKTEDHEMRKVGRIVSNRLSDNYTLSRYLELEWVNFSTIDEMVEAVEKGTIDGTFLHARIVDNIILNDHKNIFSSQIIPGLAIEYAIGVKKEAPFELFGILNKTVDSILPFDVDEIIAKYNKRSPPEFSFYTWIMRYPIWALFFAAFPFIVIISAMTAIFLNHRKAFRNGQILNKLPIRYFVIDNNGKVLQYELGNLETDSQKTIKTIYDLPVDVSDFIRNNLTEVIKSGKQAIYNYESGERCHTIVVSKLPHSLFKVDTVVAISQDTTELHLKQMQLYEALTISKQSEKLTKSASFSMNIAKGEFFGSERFDELWPKENGRRLTRKQWIYHEDHDRFEQEINRLMNGENIGIIQYRSDYYGEMRYYTLSGAIDKNISGGSLIGVIHDNSLYARLMRNEMILKKSMEQIFSNDDPLSTINEILEIIRVGMEASICYVLQYDNEKKNAICLASSYQDNIEHVLTHQISPFDSSGTWFKLLENKQPLILDDLDQPEQIALMKDWESKLKLVKAKSLYSRGIWSKNVLWGNFGMVYSGKKRLFSDLDLDFIASATHLIELLLERQEVQNALRESLQQAERLNNDLQDLVMQHNVLLDSTPVYIFAEDVNNDFRYVSCNKACEKLFNRPVSEIIGKTDYDFFANKNDAEDLRALDIAAAKSETAMEYIVPYHDQNGANRLCRLYSKALNLSGGRRWLFGVGFDITEEVEMRNSLHTALFKADEDRRNEEFITSCYSSFMYTLTEETSFAELLEKFCNYIDADRVSLIFYDTNDHTSYLEEQYNRPDMPDILNFEKGRKVPSFCDKIWDSLKKNQFTAYHDDMPLEDFASPDCICTRAIINGKIKSFYILPMYESGNIVAFFAISYVRQQKKVNVDSMKFIRSFTRMLEIIVLRREHLRDLKQALLQANSATVAKSEFLATMSHELRTPLNSVIGFSELLADADISNPDSQEYLKDINIAGKALLGLINDILDLSKIEADQMPINWHPTDIRELFNELSAIFMPVAELNGLNLSFMCPSKMPVVILDEMRLRQILLNLIGNAIKFTNSGGVKVSADYSEDSTLRLVVEDTGIGIPESKQELIFEPFVQQDILQSNRNYQGTGLGLAICKKLVEKLNGSIHLSSKLDHGSTFTLIFLEVAVSNTEKPAHADKQVDWNCNCESKKILVVDDVELNIKVLSAILRKFNMITESVNTAEAALELLKNNPFDAVFSDLWMPGMNGKELAAKIRLEPALSNTKIVMVTAETELSSKMRDEFDDVLIKPISAERVKAVLNTIFTDSCDCKHS